MNMRDYPTLHLDIHSSKWTACSRKGYDVNEHETCSFTSYPFLLQAVPLLYFVSKCNVW
jgi:hypothetical protein